MREFSNRAAVFLKMGKAATQPEAAKKCFAAAKRDAKRAREACPEYLKAHRRYREALVAAGDTAAAAAVAEELDDFAVVNEAMSWNGPVLLAAGWIDHYDLMCVYQAARMQWAVALIRATTTADGTGGRVPVSTSASLVKFQEGQWLLFCVNWVDADGKRRSVEAFSLTATDGENGALLDRPPHGEASPESLKRVAPVVASTLDRLAKCGFTVVSLTAGQGLVDHATAIEAHLKRGSPDHRAVVVIPAIATATSENHGVAVF